MKLNPKNRGIHSVSYCPLITYSIVTINEIYHVVVIITSFDDPFRSQLYVTYVYIGLYGHERMGTCMKGDTLSSQGGHYEDDCLLGCYIVLWKLTRRFRSAYCIQQHGDCPVCISATSANFYEITRHTIPQQSHILCSDISGVTRI
jgi:hypothetical protein